MRKKKKRKGILKILERSETEGIKGDGENLQGSVLRLNILLIERIIKGQIKGSERKGRFA